MRKYQLTCLLLLIFIFNTINVFAQPEFDDEVFDVPVVPIDNWIPILILVAVIITYRILSRKPIKKLIKKLN